MFEVGNHRSESIQRKSENYESDSFNYLEFGLGEEGAKVNVNENENESKRFNHARKRMK